MLTRICITVASAPQIVSLQCYTNIYIEILCLVDHKDKVKRFLRGLSLVYRVWGTWCKTWQWWQFCLWTPDIVSHITETQKGQRSMSVSCGKQPHFVWVVTDSLSPFAGKARVYCISQLAYGLPKSHGELSPTSQWKNNNRQLSTSASL